MEWRPQKEGIATDKIGSSFGVGKCRWNGDLKKKGLRRRQTTLYTFFIAHRWNGDLKKKGLRRPLTDSKLFSSVMEWRPQKEGIATHDKITKAVIRSRWNGDLKKKGLRPSVDSSSLGGSSEDGMETSKRRDCDRDIFQNPCCGPGWNGDLKKKGLRRPHLPSCFSPCF